MTATKVAHNSREAPQNAFVIFQRHGDDIGPESRAVLFHMPTLGAHVTFARGSLQGFLQVAQGLVVGVQDRYVLADDVTAAVPIDALRSGIPIRHTPLRVQQKKCIVLDPTWNLAPRGIFSRLCGSV